MALMPDISSLKVLLRIYAAADGYTPFKSDNPHVASQWVAPHADRYVESVRESVADKSLWAQKFSAIWAGTARTAMMLPAGVLDFVGPAVHEGPARGVLRMAKEIVAGSVTLTTRMASIMAGPVSALPAFDKVVAQTEWGWSALLFVDGVTSLCSRGTGGKWSSNFEVRHPVTAGMGIATDARINLPGVLLKLSDEELGSLLVKHGGNRPLAAQELGYVPGAVSNRIIQAAETSPLAKFKDVGGKRGAAPTISDVDLAALLHKHKGSRTKAAHECGLARNSVASRVLRAPKESPLAPFKEVRGQRGTPSRVSDAELVELLMQHKGNRTRAAEECVLGRSAIAERISRAPHDSPLYAFNKRYKGPVAKGETAIQQATPPASVPRLGSAYGSLSALTDAAIADVISAKRGNFMKVALELRCSTAAIARRIEMAGVDSPLRAYRNKRL